MSGDPWAADPPDLGGAAGEAGPQPQPSTRRRRLARMAVVGLVAVAALGFGQGALREWWLAAELPRAVTPRGSLAEIERQTADIFEQAAPSVAYIFTESAVRLDTGAPIPARVIGAAPDYDLAVLELERTPAGLKPIPIGASAGLRVGQAVLAIGNPFGLSRTLTTGIVSALDRRLPTSAGREVAGVIQTDASTDPGSSGGPLLDSAGRLIGVNTAILSESGASAGIGLAVPVDVVNRVVPRLIRDGKMPRAGIGIHALGEEAAARLGLAGADIGESVSLTVVRDGRTRPVEVTVSDVS